MKKTVNRIYIQRYGDTTAPFVPNQLKKVIENTVAKKVPGRKTIVTIAMDLMCRESRLVANAIWTFVSP